MKKILFAIAIMMMVGLTANAQGRRDAFFGSNWDDDNRWGESTLALTMPGSAIGSTNNYPAPLGSGLFILGALGAGYAVARKRK